MNCSKVIARLTLHAPSMTRKAFTLVELLVVIAIIAVLIGLLLPAVQAVRTRAARTYCQNNLHQIGMALYQYHDANQAFPPGSAPNASGGNSWMSLLLPYVEQQDLWNAAVQYAQTGGDPRQNPAVSTRVKTWECPADSRSLLATVVSVDGGGGDVFAFTELMGNAGTDSTLGVASQLGINDGILFCNSQVNVTQITDGTSNTLMVGERPPDNDLGFGWWFLGAGYNGSGLGDYTMGTAAVAYATHNQFSGYSCSAHNLGLRQGVVTNNCDMTHYWSLHPGGANFLFADGSVHFLSYSINNLPATGGNGNLFQALGTIAGGETFLDDYY